MKLTMTIDLAVTMAAMMNALPISASASASTYSSYTPVRVTLNELQSNDGTTKARIRAALATTGVLSVQLPRGADKDTLAHLQAACTSRSSATKMHKYADGTAKRTMATRNGLPVPHGDAECDAFDAASDNFRRYASEATSAFADRITSMLGNTDAPLLKNPEYEGIETGWYETFRDVVDGGEHLEHFHSYSFPSKESSAPGASSVEENTIEWHTDQGLFIVFTPGRRVVMEKENDARLGSPGHLTDGFLIELANGDRAQVDFDDSRDDLVIMLGDGMHRLAGDRSELFRATPHALSMPSESMPSSAVRTWYGRMVLPPNDAMIPSLGSMTFGELREGMIRESLSTDDKAESKYLSVGCSDAPNNLHSAPTPASTSSVARARQLEEGQCESGKSYCWHRCQTHAAFEISPEVCGAIVTDDRPHEVGCISGRGQLANGDKHGDYTLACIDLFTAENETALPPLDNSPRAETCNTVDAFGAFVEDVNMEVHDDEVKNSVRAFPAGSAYDHSVELLGGDRSSKALMNKGHLHYTVMKKDDGSMVLKGQLSVNRLFGWIAFGLVAQDKTHGHNGMNGAEVVLALPGGDYDQYTGLNTTLDTLIAEYEISDQSGGETDGSAFRHWSTPFVAGTAHPNNKYDVIEHECFTALTFELSSIHGRDIDMSGNGGMIEFLWAANEADYYVGYHGNTRGKVNIDFSNHNTTVNGYQVVDGKVVIPPPAEVKDKADDDSPAVRAAAGWTALVGLGLFFSIFGCL